MRRSSVMFEIHMTSFIQRHILQKPGQFLLQKSDIRLSCKTTSKMKGPISWSSRTAHHTLTLKRSWKLLSTVASGMGILICPHMRVVCIIDTVAIELRFVSKQDVTMQLATAIEPLAKFQPFRKSPGPKCITRCTWCGYMPSACSVLHTLMWRTRRSLAILRVLSRGLLCTILTMSSSSSTP